MDNHENSIEVDLIEFESSEPENSMNKEDEIIEKLHKRIITLESEIKSLKSETVTFNGSNTEILASKYQKMTDKQQKIDWNIAKSKDWKNLLTLLMKETNFDKWFFSEKLQISGEEYYGCRFSFKEINKDKTYVLTEDYEEAIKIAFYKQSVRVLEDPVYRIGVSTTKVLEIVKKTFDEENCLENIKKAFQ